MTVAVFEVPRWAVGYGEDRFGLFADLEVKGVVQRMRWIPPGSYVQGSPEGEAGRFDNEGPQRRVRFTKGFWLGDTPVTQGLYKAVMGENPSRFQSDDRPVERVKFEKVTRFLEKLGIIVPEFRGRLPSEAEWEYACRAGTPTATYVGDLEIKGYNSAPLLDRVAWYGGNCGVGFELDKLGSDIGGFPERHHRNEKWGGTHPVKQKEPNGWGLSDMLGNVWELCEDRCGSPPAPYPRGDVEDPRGHPQGEYRIVRGGSWRSSARLVRAACRSGADWPWVDVGGFLGFRLAEGS